MNDSVVRSRSVARGRRSVSARPVLEQLEGRLLMYAYTGDHFANGNRITWSIMPDGTSLGGVTSNLVSTLDSKLGAGVWEQAISDAFAQWENYGNVNVVQVSDDGEAFNAGAYQQGNANFGDIRIGGFAQAANVLAFTMLPPTANGGSASGDVFFNTAQQWNIGSSFDLETVAVHEIGHAVAGLGESSDPTAAEYEYYNGLKQGLNQDDVNGIQAVWGPRAEDAISTANINFTSARAYNITGLINPYNNVATLPNQSVASAADTYWFKVTTPTNSNNYLWVQLQSTNLSELSPKVQIYNSSLQGLTQVSASANSYGATIYASVGNVLPGQTYYIKVSGSTTLATGTGAYALSVDLGPWAMSPVVPPVVTVAAQSDQGGGGIYEQVASAETPDFSTPPPSKTKNAPVVRDSDVGSSASILIPFLPSTAPIVPPTTSASTPIQINVPRPFASFTRKLPVPQDEKATDLLD